MVPDSDAHRAGLQEGDQVLSVNEVDFQDIEHSRVSQSTVEFRSIMAYHTLYICIPTILNNSTNATITVLLSQFNFNIYTLPVIIPKCEGKTRSLLYTDYKRIKS